MTDQLTAMHFYHHGHNDGIHAACGFVWKRGDGVARFTSQPADVDCEECRRTVSAAARGVAGGGCGRD